MDYLHELDELRALAPPPPVRPLSPERLALRRRIVMQEVFRSLDVGARPTPPTRRDGSRRRPRRTALIIAAALVVVTGTVAWAVVVSSARDTVSVQCEIKGVDTVIPSATGDPMTDCAAEWQRETGNPAPPLAAYDNGDGGISVLPADQTPPSGFTRLPAGETQNVAMVQMQQWIDDYVSGLNSGCYDNSSAVTMTRQALARYSMSDWTVTVRPADPGTTSGNAPAPRPARAAPTVRAGGEGSSRSATCVDGGFLDPSSTSVTLLASVGGQGSSDAPYERLALKLRSIAQQCLSLDATARQIRQAADDLGLSESAHQYELAEVRDDSASCTTITEDVGGTIFLILRGPTS